MAHLTALPEEILLNIIDFVPNSTLLPLASCSRTFRRLVTPHIYSCVYLGSGPSTRHLHHDALQKFLVSASAAGQDDCRHVRPFKVCNLESFVRTVAASSDLASCVTDLQLEFTTVGGEVAREGVTRLLQSTKSSLGSLCLSPFECEFRLPPEASLTSLALRYNDFDWHEFKTDQDYLYSLFCISSLRKLALEGVRNWDRCRERKVESRAGTSNVTCLSLLATVPMGKDLEEIITWPKKLQTFDMDIQCTNLAFAYGARTNMLSPKELMDALRPQQSSLQALWVTAENDYRGLDDTTVGKLSDFTCLKFLSVPNGFAIRDSEGSEELRHNQVEPPLALYEMLPPSLEKLMLEYPLEEAKLCDTIDVINFGSDFDPQRAVETKEQVLGWLQDVVTHKEENYTKLAFIVLWWSDTSQPDKHSYAEQRQPFKDMPGFAELQERFKESEVDFSTWRTNQPFFSI